MLTLDQLISEATALPDATKAILIDKILESMTEQINNFPHNIPKAQVLEDFRQAWHEAMTEQGIPIAQLWKELENA
jgi:hypothetical protein